MKNILLVVFLMPSLAGRLLAQTPITGIACTADSLVSCSKAGLQVHSRESLEVQRTIKLPMRSPHDLAFSPDATQLAIGGGTPAVDGTICLFSWPSGELIAKLADHSDVVTSVCWLGNRELASGSLDGTVQIWDVSTQNKRCTLSGHSRGILSLCSIDGGRLLISAGIDQSLRVWDSSTGSLLRSMTIHTQPIRSLAAGPATTQRPMIASASDDRTIRVWQPTIGRMMRFARLDTKPICLAWLPDGSKLIAICRDQNLYMIDPADVSVEPLAMTTDCIAHAIASSPTGEHVYLGDGSKLTRQTLDVDQIPSGNKR